MLRFFIFDWISDYINTPELERTLATDALGLTAISLIMLASTVIIYILIEVYLYIKEHL